MVAGVAFSSPSSIARSPEELRRTRSKRDRFKKPFFPGGAFGRGLAAKRTTLLVSGSGKELPETFELTAEFSADGRVMENDYVLEIVFRGRPGPIVASRTYGLAIKYSKLIMHVLLGVIKSDRDPRFL